MVLKFFSKNSDMHFALIFTHIDSSATWVLWEDSSLQAWNLGSWLLSLRKCPLSLENVQIYDKTMVEMWIVSPTWEGRLPMTHVLVVTLLMFPCIASMLMHAPAWPRRQGMWTLCGDSSWLATSILSGMWQGFVVKNDHQIDTCYIVSELCAQITCTILG